MVKKKATANISNANKYNKIALAFALCEAVLNPELPKSWDKTTHHLSIAELGVFSMLLLRLSILFKSVDILVCLYVFVEYGASKVNYVWFFFKST